METISRVIVLLAVLLHIGCAPTNELDYLGTWSTERDRHAPLELGPGVEVIEITHDTFTRMRQRGTILSQFTVSDSALSWVDLALPGRTIRIESVDADHIRIDGQDYFRVDKP